MFSKNGPKPIANIMKIESVVSDLVPDTVPAGVRPIQLQSVASEWRGRGNHSDAKCPFAFKYSARSLMLPGLGIRLGCEAGSLP